MVTEEFDNKIIDYLCHGHPETLYVSFSSGAVYGRGFSAPVGENSSNNIRVNHIAKEDCYSIVKLNSEAKHRAFENLRIADLRLFSYFSRFTDLTDGYFITELIKHLLEGKAFKVTADDFIRDYLHPDDLFSVIKKCIEIKKINAAFDVNSARPAKKTEILEYFAGKYGLKYEVDKNFDYKSATGIKNVYYSANNKATTELGYQPKYSSLEGIKQEAEYILNK